MKLTGKSTSAISHGPYIGPLIVNKVDHFDEWYYVKTEIIDEPTTAMVRVCDEWETDDTEVFPDRRCWYYGSRTTDHILKDGADVDIEAKSIDIPKGVTVIIRKSLNWEPKYRNSIRKSIGPYTGPLHIPKFPQHQYLRELKISKTEVGYKYVRLCRYQEANWKKCGEIKIDDGIIMEKIYQFKTVNEVDFSFSGNEKLGSVEIPKTHAIYLYRSTEDDKDTCTKWMPSLHYKSTTVTQVEDEKHVAFMLVEKGKSVYQHRTKCATKMLVPPQVL